MILQPVYLGAIAKVAPLLSKGSNLPYMADTGKRVYFRPIHFVLLVSFLLGMAGCQQESVQIAPIPTEEAVTIDAPVAQLLLRVVTLDGSRDNIVDNASCSSLVFPISLIVNGQPVIVTSEEELDAIERIFDESNSDDDTVVIQFPVTVTFPDYSTQVINSHDAFEDLVEDCLEGGEDDDIECVDLNYPVRIATYDPTNQRSNVVTLTSDKDTYQFLSQLTGDVLIALQFPVVLVDSAGAETAVNDYKELEDLLLGSDDCDEDDDNDFDDDDIDTSELYGVISNGSWVVESYFDKTNQTAAFSGYNFVFAADSSMTATLGGNVIPGRWILYGDSGELEWEIEFDDEDPVNELNEDWTVVLYTTTRIELVDKPDSTKAKRLIFTKP